MIDQQNEAAKEFEERHKKDLEKVKDMKLEEWVWVDFGHYVASFES